MLQLALAFFGLTALWLAMGQSERGRRWAPVIGLMGQPAWCYFAWSVSAWGLLALSLAYTAVYVRGAWVQWGCSWLAIERSVRGYAARDVASLRAKLAYYWTADQALWRLTPSERRAYEAGRHLPRGQSVR